MLNYTTKIDAAKTASQIQALLAYHGARSILMEYDDHGEIIALSFEANTPHGQLPIRLPIDVKATLRVMERERMLGKIPRTFVNEAQARRTAWRILKDWVAAQMAILETEMVKMEQIFLPYVVTADGRTVFEIATNSKFQLTQGEKVG